MVLDDDTDVGYVEDGTPCGPSMMCLDRKCLQIQALNMSSCPLDSKGKVCSGHGVSNRLDSSLNLCCLGILQVHGGCFHFSHSPPVAVANIYALCLLPQYPYVLRITPVCVDNGFIFVVSFTTGCVYSLHCFNLTSK